MLEPTQLEKTELLSEKDGCKVWATTDRDIAVMEWASEEACQIAYDLHELTRKHALSTNFRDRLGRRELVVRRLELLNLALVARCTVHDTHLEFLDSSGTPMEKGEVERIPDVTSSRLEVIEDAAAHVARCVRAHLAAAGVTDLELRLQFGLGGQGETLLQVINPLSCRLGTGDMSALDMWVGGVPDDSVIDLSRSGDQANP